MRPRRLPLCLALVLLNVPFVNAEDLRLQLRSRVPADKGDGYEAVVRIADWQPRETAMIVCDMWDHHHCPTAERRVGEIAPRMNEVVDAARKRGVLIIHAPSSCMEAYKDHPGRRRAEQAPKAAELPTDIAQWCRKIPAEEKGTYPIDQTDGGCDCTTPEQTAHDEYLTKLGRNPKAPWKRQVDLITIRDEDAISDSGVEIWNLLTQRG